MALNLNEFVEYYAEHNNMYKTNSKEEITRFIETFKSATIENGGVNLTGFIESQVVDKPAHESQNPRTKEKIMIPAKKVIKVKIKPTFAKMAQED